MGIQFHAPTQEIDTSPAKQNPNNVESSGDRGLGQTAIVQPRNKEIVDASLDQVSWHVNSRVCALFTASPQPSNTHPHLAYASRDKNLGEVISQGSALKASHALEILFLQTRFPTSFRDHERVPSETPI
jgi:hypothetical protein